MCANMNELLIDVGNSRLKYAEVADGQITRAFAVGHGDGDWRGMFERGLRDLARPDRIRLAAVAHEMVTQAALATLKLVWPDMAIERITSALWAIAAVYLAIGIFDSRLII